LQHLFDEAVRTWKAIDTAVQAEDEAGDALRRFRPEPPKHLLINVSKDPVRHPVIVPMDADGINHTFDETVRRCDSADKIATLNAKRQQLLADLKKWQSACGQADKKSGLAKVKAAKAEADRAHDEAIARLLATPARTAFGVLLKLQVIDELAVIDDFYMGRMIRSAMKDLKAIVRTQSGKHRSVAVVSPDGATALLTAAKKLKRSPAAAEVAS
jgi:hypothetical protein